MAAGPKPPFESRKEVAISPSGFVWACRHCGTVSGNFAHREFCAKCGCLKDAVGKDTKIP
jgi:hypothetical protein